MFPGAPEQRLWLAKQQQAPLIHEAEQYRLATRIRGDRTDNLSTPRFARIRASLAHLSPVVRRALTRDSISPARSFAAQRALPHAAMSAAGVASIDAIAG
jgi:hypothetical protein